MNQFILNFIAFLAILPSACLYGAAKNEQDIAVEKWQSVLAKSGTTPQLLPYSMPLFFRNNTNLQIELILNTMANEPQRIIVDPTETQLLGSEAQQFFSFAGVSVTESVIKGGSTLYGFQVFNLESAIAAFLRDNESASDSPIVLTLERQRTWRDPIGLTFKITASSGTQQKAGPEALEDENEFIELLATDNESNAKGITGLTDSELIFYNGSHFSIALTFEQNDTVHRIIVGPGKKALLGKDVATGINLSTVSVFGGTSSPLPMIAQYYQSIDFNLIDILKEKVYEPGIYQINLPARNWNVTAEKLSSVPNEAIPAAAFEQTIASEIAAQESQTPFDVKTELQIAEIGRQLYNALTTRDQDQINILTKQISDLYEGSAEAGLLKALTLYFYYIARKIGHIFNEGTFVIHDPSGTVYPFIENLKGTYTRNASHFNALASKQLPDSKPWLAQLGKNHRGHDVEIPAMHKKTLLFNYLAPDKTVFYLKPESHGTEGIISLAAHTGDFLVSLGRKQLPSIFGSDDQPAYSKERIPKELLRKFLKLIESLPEDNATKAAFAQDAVTYGIQSMYKHAQALKQKYPEDKALSDFVAHFETKSREGDPKFSHLQNRYGYEAIITPDEFEQFKNPIDSSDTFNSGGK